MQLEHPDRTALLQEVHALGHLTAPQRHCATPARHDGDELLDALDEALDEVAAEEVAFEVREAASPSYDIDETIQAAEHIVMG